MPRCVDSTTLIAIIRTGIGEHAHGTRSAQFGAEGARRAEGGDDHSQSATSVCDGELKVGGERAVGRSKCTEPSSIAQTLGSNDDLQLEQRHADLAAKHLALEAEHQELRSKQELGLPSAAGSQQHGSLEPANGRKPRLSSGASDLEKQVIGFRQMIEDLQNENGELYQTIQDLHAQMKTADDDNKELASVNKQTQEVYLRRTTSSRYLLTRCFISAQELDALHAAIESRLDPMERASEHCSETGDGSALNNKEVSLLVTLTLLGYLYTDHATRNRSPNSGPRSVFWKRNEANF
jgi:hypothetical protein